MLRSSLSLQNRFVPADPMQYLPPVAIRGLNEEPEQVEFCSRTMFLPDISMLHGRVFVTAWEYGLEGVAEKAVPLIMNAVQVSLNDEKLFPSCLNFLQNRCILPIFLLTYNKLQYKILKAY